MRVENEKPCAVAEDNGQGKSKVGNSKNLKNDYINSGVEINRAFPHDTEAEANLIRSCLASPDAVDKVLKFIEPEDFYSLGCQLIFKQMCEFKRNDQSYTPTLLIESFMQHPDFERLELFITDLGPFWTSQDWPHWAGIIRDLSIRRELIKAGVQAIEACFDITPDIVETIETFGNEIRHLKKRNLEPLAKTEACHAA